MATVESLNGLDGGETHVGIDVRNGTLCKHGSHAHVLLSEARKGLRDRLANLSVLIVERPRDEVPHRRGLAGDDGADHLGCSAAQMDIGLEQEGVNMVSHDVRPCFGQRLQSTPGGLAAFF